MQALKSVFLRLMTPALPGKFRNRGRQMFQSTICFGLTAIWSLLLTAVGYTKLTRRSISQTKDLIMSASRPRIANVLANGPVHALGAHMAFPAQMMMFISPARWA